MFNSTIKVVAVLALGLLMSTPAWSHTHKVHHKVHQKTYHKHIAHNVCAHVVYKTPTDRITAFIFAVQPKRGIKYAQKVAKLIVQNAQAKGLSPYFVASTCYIESEFNMNASGGLGMMQISPGTYRARHYAREGLRATRLADNISIGTNELYLHYQALPSRGGYDRLAGAWGYYNGSGPHSQYVHRAMTVLKRLQTGDINTWKEHLRTRGPLWK